MNWAAVFGGRWARTGLGLAVGLVFFYLAARETDWAEVGAAIQKASPVWVLVSMGLYASAIFLRIVRWRLILNFVTHLRYRQVAIALVVGYAINTILPARLGELFRADFVKRQYGVPGSLVLGTIGVERLMDGIFIVSALVAGILFASGPLETDISLAWLAAAGAFLFVSVGIVLFLLGGDYHWGSQWPSLGSRLAALRDSARIVRHPTIVLVAAMTAPIWFCDMAAIWAMMRAFGISLAPIEMCAAIGIIGLSTLLPSPPAFLGTMQYAFVISATLFGYSAAQGVASATAVQVFLLGPLSIVGLMQLSRHFIADTRQGNRRAPIR